MPRETRSSAANSPTKAKMSTLSKEVKHATPLTFVLPKGTSTEARFLLINDPASGRPKRYLFDPSSGLFEFTKITVPSIDPRSTLFAAGHPVSELPNDQTAPATSEGDIASGYTSNKPDIMIATPMDEIFLALPALSASLAKSKRDTGKGLLLSLDDLFDGVEDEDKHFGYLLRHQEYRPVFEKRLESICDTVEAGDEKMFRLNEDKLLKTIIQKANRMVAQGLPASVEEKFITRALEAPVLSVKREDSSITLAPENTEASDSVEGVDSQSTTASTAASTVISEESSATSTNSIVEDSTPSAILGLLRLRTAISFLTASYLSTETSSSLESKLSTKDSPVDFTPLNEHLKHLADLRAEAAASRSFGDFSRKRNAEDEDAAEIKAEKKRKLEEEEKRKKIGMSRGVRDLQKVNVSGMKKMSDFFSKKPATTKAKT